jgi:hypothetical protein
MRNNLEEFSCLKSNLLIYGVLQDIVEYYKHVANTPFFVLCNFYKVKIAVNFMDSVWAKINVRRNF